MATNDPTWVLWTLDIYRRTDRVPPVDVVERVGEAAAKHRGVVRGGLAALMQHLDRSARSPSPGDLEAIARLEQMRSVLEPGPGEGVGDVSEVTGEWPRPS
jgi:hypothetical protein